MSRLLYYNYNYILSKLAGHIGKYSSSVNGNRAVYWFLISPTSCFCEPNAEMPHFVNIFLSLTQNLHSLNPTLQISHVWDLFSFPKCSQKPFQVYFENEPICQASLDLIHRPDPRNRPVAIAINKYLNQSIDCLTLIYTLNSLYFTPIYGPSNLSYNSPHSNIYTIMDENLDWLYDYLLQFLKSPGWRVPILDFIDQHCYIFEDSNENKLVYTEIHNVTST